MPIIIDFQPRGMRQFWKRLAASIEGRDHATKEDPEGLSVQESVRQARSAAASLPRFTQVTRDPEAPSVEAANHSEANGLSAAAPVSHAGAGRLPNDADLEQPLQTAALPSPAERSLFGAGLQLGGDDYG